MKTKIDLRDIWVVAPSLHWHYSGVTSTIITLLPHQSKHLPIAGLGPFLPSNVPQVSFWQILKQGWSKPKGKPFRIWHARRNNEMLVVLLLKYVLRQPWRIVFTRAGQRKLTPLTRWFLQQTNAVIATSEAAASYLEPPVTVIHHGVDTQRFHPSDNKETSWAETGLPGRFGIGAFGRIRPEKGSDLFVESMIQLLPKYPEATVVITGLVAAKHQAFAVSLKKQIADAGLEQRILFLGQQPTDDMPKWFRCVSLYVAPMRWEGFGLTPLEAMASGTAVVATKTGAAPLLVADGVTGTLIPPNDLDAQVNAIETMLAHPEKMSVMGQAGREKVMAHHDIEMEVAAIQAVYERVWNKDGHSS